MRGRWVESGAMVGILDPSVDIFMFALGVRPKMPDIGEGWRNINKVGTEEFKRDVLDRTAG